MGGASSIANGVFLLLFAFVLSTLMHAIILRAAISLYNKLAGGDDSPRVVEEPCIGKALGIMFAANLLTFGAGYFLDVALTTGAGEPQPLVQVLVTIPLSAVIIAGMLTARLPTTLDRAVLVTLCYLLIVALIFGVLFLVFWTALA